MTLGLVPVGPCLLARRGQSSLHWDEPSGGEDPVSNAFLAVNRRSTGASPVAAGAIHRKRQSQEIRISKSETHSKHECQKTRTEDGFEHLIFGFVICFGFRASNFGFSVA